MMLGLHKDFIAFNNVEEHHKVTILNGQQISIQPIKCIKSPNYYEPNLEKRSD